MSASQRVLPSPIYVFVVMSLAAFLTLFTIVRKQGVVYETSAEFAVEVANSTELPEALIETVWVQAESKLIRPTFVLDAMRHSKIVPADCETTPETLAIAKGITDRMRFRKLYPGDNKPNAPRCAIVLLTEKPDVGNQLLDTMLADLAKTSSHQITAAPAAVARKHGGSVSSTGLFLLLASSCMLGFLGLMLHDSSKQTEVLYTNDEVTEIAGVPVVADFVEDGTFPAREAIMVRRRAFHLSLRFAELVVAAVFLLMVCNLAIRDAFMSRFVSNPLAAYSEVLSTLMG